MKVLIVPTFNEKDTLPIFLDKVLEKWNQDDLIVISDDSEDAHRRNIIETVEMKRNADFKILFMSGPLKGGRGAAVRRAMEKLVAENFNFSHIIEADADGSHRVEDIIMLRDFDDSCDFLIGSRYLNQSRIYGWSISRRSLSTLLNLLIPILIGIQTSDITNGLRRYSQKSVDILLKEPSLNSGFIYLSEQAFKLASTGIKPIDLPINFMPRVSGTSSVTSKDLLLSLSGILKLWRMSKQKR